MKAEDFEKFRSPPAVWLVREEIANSPGSPIWDTTKGKFGVFEGQMFIGDQRQSNYFRSGVEKVNGEYQGWCVDFLRGLDSGPVKMSFDSKEDLVRSVGGEVGSVKEEKEPPFSMWNGTEKPIRLRFTRSI